jgi:hypothetical protein
MRSWGQTLNWAPSVGRTRENRWKNREARRTQTGATRQRAQRDFFYFHIYFFMNLQIYTSLSMFCKTIPMPPFEIASSLKTIITFSYELEWKKTLYEIYTFVEVYNFVLQIFSFKIILRLK